MTFTGRWFSERGTEAQTKVRYLFPHNEGSSNLENFTR